MKKKRNKKQREIERARDANIFNDGFKHGYQVAQIEKNRMEERVMNLSSREEHIAKICHEVNRAYCISIGDNSQPSWENAPTWQKESAINGVKFHMEKDATPAESHNNWYRDKDADGWVYGPVKDPEKKEHPCMVPYDQLPKEQQTKDYLFKAVIDSFK